MATDGSSRNGTFDLAESMADEAIRVFHVDDEPAFLDLAETFLSRYGLSVSTAETPEAARQHLARRDVDCIVSDYDMPDENGVEFLRSVRETHPKLPFVLFTGKGSEAVASEAISAGVTDYLQKGTGTGQWRVLANRIENLVQRHRSERLVEYSFRAMETAREGISLLDEDGRFVYLNRAYTDVVGYDGDDLLGEHWETLYPAGRVEEVYEEVLPAVRRHGAWEGEAVYLRKDGSEVPVDHALSYTAGDGLVCLVRRID